MKTTNSNLPVLMYIHGFMSGANGSKPRQLANCFGDRYRIVAPELTADPTSALAEINRLIRTEHPRIIVGTSLGGWMTMACDSGDARLVVVNPCTEPRMQLARWLNQPQEYFCKRLDGEQTYTLTQEVLDRYAAYGPIQALAASKADRLHALCSTTDELLGVRHIEVMSDILPPEHLTIVDDFGHQCNGAGLSHLYSIIDKLG